MYIDLRIEQKGLNHNHCVLTRRDAFLCLRGHYEYLYLRTIVHFTFKWASMIIVKSTFDLTYRVHKCINTDTI